MIPARFKERFNGDSGVDIGMQEIDAVFPDGERRRVVLRVGAPFRRDNVQPTSPQDNFYWIRTELENLDRTDGPLGGEGTFDALIGAIAFIVARLEIFEKKHGCKYFWPGSDDVFNYRRLLSTTKLL